MEALLSAASLTPTQMAKHNGQRLCIDLKYSHTTQKLCFMFGFNTTHWLSEKKIMTLLDKRNSSDVNTTSEVMCFVLFRCYKARVLWDFGCEKQKVCKMLCGVCCPVGQMIVGCVCLHTVKASVTIYLLCLAERTPNRRFQSLAISFFSFFHFRIRIFLNCSVKLCWNFYLVLYQEVLLCLQRDFSRWQKTNQYLFIQQKIFSQASTVNLQCSVALARTASHHALLI